MSRSGEMYEPKPQTNADRIRSMSDEELAQILFAINDGDGYCKNLPECAALLNTEEGIPDEKCIQCVVAWLQQPAEEATP